MVRHPSDVEVERLVERSATFRGVRAVLLALDRSLAASSLVRALPPGMPLASVALVLVVASLTHALLVSFVPRSLAPIGRYLFGAAGLTCGVGLLVADRWRNSIER